MASGRIRFQIHQFFLLFSAASHSSTALISACMQNVWRNKIKNKMPHTQRGFGLSTQYFSCIEWIKYSVLSISQWHSHNIYRLLCSASSMSLLPSPSQILISSYVLFIAVKESGTQSLYLPMSCLPAHRCGMASRIWGQLRDVGRPNCRRFAPLRLQDDLSLSSSGWGKSPAGTQVVHTCFATAADVKPGMATEVVCRHWKHLSHFVCTSRQSARGRATTAVSSTWWCYRLPIAPGGDKGWSDLLWPCVVGRAVDRDSPGGRDHIKSARSLFLSIPLLCSLPGLYQLRYGLLSL